MMGELNYKELQEQGVFDVPYRAFEFMQEQQAKIDELSRKVESNLEINKNLQTMVDELIDERDELQANIDESLEYLNNLSWASELDVENVRNTLKGNKDEN